MTAVRFARDDKAFETTNGCVDDRDARPDHAHDPSSCASAETLRVALETMPHALCMFDAEQRLVYSNPQYSELYGLPRGLLRTGMSLREVVAHRMRHGLLTIDDPEAYRTSILAGAAANIASSTRVELADGRAFEIMHRPTSDGGWVAIHDDISARAIAERDLLQTRASLIDARANAEAAAKESRAAHDLLREAFDAVPEGLVLFDAEDRYVLWNARYLELCGLAEGQVQPGVRLVDVLRGQLEQGYFPDAIGREEEWLADRLALHTLSHNSHEQQTGDGRWLRIVARRTGNGGSIGIRMDVTELKRREASFKLLFDANPVPMMLFDRETLRILAVNDAALALYGHDRDRMLAMTVLDVRPEGDRARLREAGVEAGSLPDRLWTHLRADGSEMRVEVYGKGLDYEDRPARLCAIVDQTEALKIADELTQTRAFLNSVVETIPVMVFAKDMANEGRYVLFNRAGEDLLERPRDEVLGHTDLEVHGAENAARFDRQDRKILNDGSVRSFEATRIRRDGTKSLTSTKKVAIQDPSGGKPRFILGVAEDITERRDYDRRLAHMAHHDVLTDLPNRALFRDRLSMASARAARHRELLAVMWIDLDRFKEVNDAHGHQTGDALLQAVAARLRETLRTSDTAARLGGDEFALLLAPIRSREDATALAVRLLDTLAAPFDLQGRRVCIGASIGVALSSGSERDPEALLHNADVALYRAKGNGRGTYKVFEPEMDVEIKGQDSLAKEIRQALAEDQFELFYQPIMAVATHRIAGFEALLRWRHPARGLLAPAEFIQIAEDVGVIVSLGSWALRRACLDALFWPDSIRIAVNLSPAQFRPGDLATIAADALAASGLPAHRLELEITESVQLNPNDANLATLHDLRKAGVTISLDDFGTGYSSLSYLRAFPFDRLKIDRSFVGELVGSGDCLSIVRAIVGLGSSFGVKTTAEGVETLEQLARLLEEGCDEVQGFLVSQPLPRDMATRFLRDRDPWSPGAFSAPDPEMARPWSGRTGTRTAAE